MLLQILSAFSISSSPKQLKYKKYRIKDAGIYLASFYYKLMWIWIRKRGVCVNKSDIKNTVNRMEMTVKGRKVTLYFADEPNPDVAMQVKQVLLSTCLLAADSRTTNKSSNTSNFQ